MAWPIICYNHATPEAVFPFSAPSLSSVLAEDKSPEVYRKRGWIWLGGGKVRLNLASGAGPQGEIFHFYETSGGNNFLELIYETYPENQPPTFASPLSLPMDLEIPPGYPPLGWELFRFNHCQVLRGFYDKCVHLSHDAMYENPLLSRTIDLPVFGARSSMLHLFGSTMKGFQSRTKVFGKVALAFPRLAHLELLPENPNLKFLSSWAPPSFPVVIPLPSLSSSEFKPRKIFPANPPGLGGPVLPIGELFADQTVYSDFMSRIVEKPYITAYNTMEDIQTVGDERHFKSLHPVLAEDESQEITLKRDDLLLYQGSVSAPPLLKVIKRRVQKKVGSIEEFWDMFYDPAKQALNLNAIVEITNPAKATLLFPPDNVPYPLKVRGGGMIILDEGNLVLRGVQMQSPREALTLVLDRGTLVKFETPNQNQVNIAAPNAELDYGSRMELTGTLCLNTVRPEARTSGGFLQFRPEQDPTTNESQAFLKIRVNDLDTYWHE